MKNRYYIILAAIILVGCKSHDINVMTYNIRMNTPNDGENAWPNRADILTNQIIDSKASIIGVQEALPDQMQDMERLMPNYDFIGIG